MQPQDRKGSRKGKGAFRVLQVQPEQLALQAGAVISMEAGDTELTGNSVL